MFCEEQIQKVYIGVTEDDECLYYAYLDCYCEIAYHCAEGYRIVLETENYAISLSCRGVTKEPKETLCERKGEWLQEGVEIIDDDSPPFVRLETTLFVGERLLSVTQDNNRFFVQFDDFALKIVPHPQGDNMHSIKEKPSGMYRRVLGCDRHLKKKCPHCGGNGEIIENFIDNYLVKCKECGSFTWAGQDLATAIADWNNGDAQKGKKTVRRCQNAT